MILSEKHENLTLIRSMTPHTRMIRLEAPNTTPASTLVLTFSLRNVWSNKDLSLSEKKCFLYIFLSGIVEYRTGWLSPATPTRGYWLRRRSLFSSRSFASAAPRSFRPREKLTSLDKRRKECSSDSGRRSLFSSRSFASATPRSFRTREKLTSSV